MAPQLLLFFNVSHPVFFFWTTNWATQGFASGQHVAHRPQIKYNLYRELSALSYIHTLVAFNLEFSNHMYVHKSGELRRTQKILCIPLQYI